MAPKERSAMRLCEKRARLLKKAGRWRDHDASLSEMPGGQSGMSDIVGTARASAALILSVTALLPAQLGERIVKLKVLPTIQYW